MGNQATTLRRLRQPAFAIAILCGLLGGPICALAARAHGSGGSGLIGGNDDGPPPESTTAPVVDRVNGPVSVHGDGITLATVASGQTGARLTFTGTARGDGGRVLEIEYRAKPGTRWQRAARAIVTAGNAYETSWRPRACGDLRFRAVLLPASGNSNSTMESADASEPTTPALGVTVFRSARATYYGPGFWGHRTACGRRLRRRTLGVASRTLRCGTRIAVYYRGREIVVPVIDRGPYGRHPARWDLTQATARALGIRETVRVGTLTLS